MTHLDDPHELDVVKPHDVDDAMFELDVALAADADRHARCPALWGRADMLVDMLGTVVYG